MGRTIVTAAAAGSLMRKASDGRRAVFGRARQIAIAFQLSLRRGRPVATSETVCSRAGGALQWVQIPGAASKAADLGGERPLPSIARFRTATYPMVATSTDWCVQQETDLPSRVPAGDRRGIKGAPAIRGRSLRTGNRGVLLLEDTNPALDLAHVGDSLVAGVDEAELAIEHRVPGGQIPEPFMNDLSRLTQPFCPIPSDLARSIGRGKTMVELFSPAILSSVPR